jgi:predicted MPP superfamily phosphohydrolase
MKRWLIGCLIGIVTLISVLIIYGVFIEPYRIEIHHVFIHDPHLGRILGKNTLIRLSDLHIENMGKREQKILKILDDLQPDIIFLTGDYVKWNGDYEAALNFLSQLRAGIGIWAVMGDYDYSNSRKSCLFCHEPERGRFTTRHSVRFLRNTSEIVNLQEGAVRIWGVDVKGGRPFSYEKNFFPLRSKDPARVRKRCQVYTLDKRKDE